MSRNYSDSSQYEQSEQQVQDELEINNEFVNQFPDSFLVNWFAPGARQKIEAQQSLDMWKLQNAYDSPEEQMKRAADAGINLNTAAAAAVGANTSANPLQPSSSAMNAGVQPSDVAEAALGAVGAVQKNKEIAMQKELNESSIQLNAALTAQAFAGAGYNKELAEGASIDNKYKDQHNVADLYVKSAQFENMKQQWDVLERQKEEYDIRLSHLDELIESEIDLNQKNALVAQKQQLQIEASTTYQNLVNEFFRSNGFDPSSPVDVGLRNTWLQCSKSGDYSAYQSMLGFTSEYFYNLHFNSSKGENLGTWYKLPSNPYEMANSIGKSIIESTDGQQLLDKWKHGDGTVYDDFWKIDDYRDAYEDRRDQLAAAYYEARDRYRSYRHSGASDAEIASLRVKRDKAKQILDEFTFKKFVDEVNGNTFVLKNGHWVDVENPKLPNK